MQKMIILLPILMLFGCGQEISDIKTSKDINQIQKVIVGAVDWQEVSSFASTDQKYINSKAVAILSLPAKDSRCTAFLVNEDMIMTNAHCVSSSTDTRGATATFNLVAGVDSKKLIKYDCSEYIMSNQDLDVAVLRCANSPGLKYGVVKFAPSEVINYKKSAYVIHQNCDYYYNGQDCRPDKKISFGKVSGFEDIDMLYDADTLGGSSGSPVFSSTSNKLIALHHMGYGNTGFGRGTHNGAVQIKLIVDFFAANYPGILKYTNKDDDTSDVDVVVNRGLEKISTPFDAQRRVISSLQKGFYEFNIFRLSQAIKIRIEFKHQTANLNLFLYDQSGRLVDYSTSSNDFEEISKILPTGKYYVVVETVDGSPNNYRIRVK